MPRVPWEQRRDKLSGALWVIPVLFMAGAIAVGGLLSLINIGPDSAIAPLLFRGHADEAQKVLLAIVGTLVGVLALVIGLTMIALQVAANRYSPRLMRSFLRDRPAQIVLGLFVATIIYNGAGVYIVGQPAGTAETKYPRLAVTVGLGLLFVCIAVLVFFADHMMHQIQIDAVLARCRRSTMQTLATEPPGVGRNCGKQKFDMPPPWAIAVRARHSGYVQTIHPETLVAVADATQVTVRLVPTIGDHIVEGTPLARVWRTSPEQRVAEDGQLVRALAAAVTIGPERTMRQDVGLGFIQIVDVALLSLHIYDFQTAIQAINELSTLLCKCSQYAMGDEALRSGDGAVRVICPSPSFEQYLDLACGEIRRRGAGETMISRALLRLLRQVGSVVTTDKRRAYVLNQISLAVATAERSIQEPGDLTHFRAEAAYATGLVDTVSDPLPIGDSGHVPPRGV